MAPVGFETAIPVTKRPKTCALGHVATGISNFPFLFYFDVNFSMILYYIVQLVHKVNVITVYL
jgi:hypothetical protein